MIVLAGVTATCRARLRLRGTWLIGIGLAGVTMAGVAAFAVESPARATALAGSAALYPGLVAVALLVGGWLGQELSPGTVDFWLQTPRPPLATFASRFGAVAFTGLSLAALLALGVAGVIRLAGVPGGAERVVVGLPGMLLIHLVLVSLLWAVGGWGVRGDAPVAVLLAVALAALELVVRLRPVWLGPAVGVADVIGLPLDDLGLAAALLSGRGGGEVGSLARVGAWIAGWGMVGALGILRTSVRPE